VRTPSWPSKARNSLSRLAHLFLTKIAVLGPETSTARLDSAAPPPPIARPPIFAEQVGPLEPGTHVPVDDLLEAPCRDAVRQRQPLRPRERGAGPEARGIAGGAERRPPGR